MTEHQAADVARAVEYYHKGNASRWITAYFAARVVGMRDGKTRQLAQALAVSEDTVYDLARAAITYIWLKTVTRCDLSMFRVVSEMRRRLTWSHFAEAGKLAKRFDLDPLDVFALLQVATENGTAVKVMAAQVEDEQGGGASDKDWRKAAKRTVNNLLDLAANSDVPQPVAVWAGKAAAAYEKIKVE